MKVHYLLDCPFVLYNCEESGFPVLPRTGRVLEPVGCRYVNRVNSGNKTFHIYPGKRFKQNPLEDGVPNAYFGESEI